jgi:membrane protein required for colicin V production
MAEVSITAIDVLVVLVVLASAGFAMWRGLVSETLTIIDWVAAAFVALRFTPVFLPLMRGMISPAWLEYVAVFVGTFLLMFIPLSILNHRFSEMVKKSEVGPVDRVLGLLFGAGRGLVIVGIGYIAFSALVPLRDHPDSLTHARLYPLIRQTSDVLLGLLPGERSITAPREATDASVKTAPATVVERSAAKPATPAPAQAADKAKTYDATDRDALNKLIQGSSK